ncbi:hypothetical protein SBV1_1000009 [Verrucomicrobia bacterium]|nr:hypothetical protein SBV1_1000009 [Verrucomicrobiota bacterium]
MNRKRQDAARSADYKSAIQQIKNLRYSTNARARAWRRAMGSGVGRQTIADRRRIRLKSALS